jgi:hypothetical protein
MLEVAPTSIQSQKGMRAQHPRLSRSRRDTPSKGRISDLRHSDAERLSSADYGHSFGSGRPADFDP